MAIARCDRKFLQDPLLNVTYNSSSFAFARPIARFAEPGEGGTSHEAGSLQTHESSSKSLFALTA